MLLEHAIKCLISLLVSLCKDPSVCCHNTGMSSDPSDHTCDSARSKHILYWCCDLIFVQRTQLGKEEGQKVEGREDKLAVWLFWVFFGCLLSKIGRETDQPWKFSVCMVLMDELRMCSRSFFGTIIFATWEKIFHLDYQQRYFVWFPATF